MTANIQVKPPLLPSIPPSPTPNTSFSRPSVPMTVYREVVQELQFTQERVDELLSQNQKLVQQNKVLRQEIERVIELSQQLQKIIAASEKPYIPSDPPQKQFVEIKQHLLDSPSLSETDSGMNGWLLAIAISLIILISCGGAFLVVNSLLKK